MTICNNADMLQGFLALGYTLFGLHWVNPCIGLDLINTYDACMHNVSISSYSSISLAEPAISARDRKTNYSVYFSYISYKTQKFFIGEVSYTSLNYFHPS